MPPPILIDPHPCLVPFDGTFDLDRAPTHPGDERIESENWKRRLEAEKRALGNWQHKLFADGRFAMLLVFQAMDAGGKDSTIRHVLTGVNPTGVRVTSFRKPSRSELDHDFLWRTSRALPARGEIGVFNRSHYEEVLVVRVHDELLADQRIAPPVDDAFWQSRFRSINEHERHLAESGTIVLKFWLNVSKEEQRRRLLGRIERPNKHWKFRAADIEERARWDDYMAAYAACLEATSKPWAPWYAIPADHKPFMRWQVAALVNAVFERLGVDFPPVPSADEAEIEAARETLEAQAP